MSLVEKLLDKKGLTLENLTPEERATYDGYKLTLTKKEIKTEDLEKFCLSQIALIEDKFGSPGSENDFYLKACIHVYLTLLKAIRAPKVERERLERYLIALISES